MLIVDDEPDNLQAIEDIFINANAPYKIIKSPNGVTALQLAQKKIPDLIITDWDMPEMDGIELIRQLKNKKNTEDIPVIMCTGVMTASENLKTALNAGAADYVTKPVDPIELIARTNSMLNLGASFKEIREKNRELSESYEKMERIARTDPLTQISNRRDFLDKIEHEKAASERNGKSFVLVICDIDKFKKFNDQYGHDCGDFVLVSVAEELKKAVRKQDYLGRWGGEEFILMFPETDLEGAKIITEKIRKKIADITYKYNSLSLKITMTFGVCLYNDSFGIGKCLKIADEALYRGKKAGRNQVVLADEK